MIQYLTHNQIDKQKWNELISNSTNPLLYAMSWYLDTCCPNWGALVSSDYTIGMPLTHNKKIGFIYLFQPHFCQQLGVFSKKEIPKNETLEILNNIPKEFRFIEINLNSGNKIQTNDFTVTKMKNYELILDSSYESIATNFSKNTKRNINKANNEIAILDNKHSVADLILLFKADKPKLSKKLGTSYFDVLINLSEAVKKEAELKVLTATKNNNLLAGIMLFNYMGRSILIFTGNSEQGKQTGAMHGLVGRAIEINCNAQCIFDFEGSNNEGLARFYASFGATENVYLRLRKNNLPAWVKWMKE